MYIYEINSDILNKCLAENEYVLLGVLSEDFILNNLFRANLKKLNTLVDSTIVIGVMTISTYHSLRKNDIITPRINLYKNGELVKEIIGFKRCVNILNELDIFKIARKIA